MIEIEWLSLKGLICKYTGGSKSRWGLVVLVLWGVLGVICLYFARLFNFQDYYMENEKEKDLEKEENIKEIFLKNNELGENNNADFSKKKIMRKNTGELPVMQYNFRDKSRMITKLFGRISNA